LTSGINFQNFIALLIAIDSFYLLYMLITLALSLWFTCLCFFFSLKEPIPVKLLSSCQMVRYLYDMALDAFDR